MRLLDSLRRRLVASMLLVFAMGLGMAIIARPFEGTGGLLSRLDVDFVQEPYQDVLVLLLFTAVATAITVLVSAWSLRPLREASGEAAEVGPRNPDARITTARLPREIRPLVGAVNEALDRMAQAFAAERRFVADAAHELRTPLTVVSLRLQEARLSRSPDWTQIDQDVAQVSRVVRQLLDLARKDFEGPAVSRTFELLDLGRSAREAAALIVPLADAAGRQIKLDLPERMPIRGRPDDLREMFRNLLENALLHGRGPIQVSGSRDRDGTVQVVTVADEGTTLVPADREAMFDRFRKASSNSGGSGLGLAIVRGIVRLHGGAVSFEPGKRTAVRVSIPTVVDREA